MSVLTVKPSWHKSSGRCSFTPRTFEVSAHVDSNKHTHAATNTQNETSQRFAGKGQLVRGPTASSADKRVFAGHLLRVSVTASMDRLCICVCVCVCVCTWSSSITVGVKVVRAPRRAAVTQAGIKTLIRPAGGAQGRADSNQLTSPADANAAG